MQNKTEHRIQMLEMILRWKQSGQTQRAFCAGSSIAYHIFHYWYRVYRQEQNTARVFFTIKSNHLGSAGTNYCQRDQWD